MINTNSAARRLLRGGTALSALGLLGAGLVASVVLTAPAAAQDYTNVNANGRVTTEDGSPLAGATVQVTSNAQGFSRTATTDTNGQYRIPGLPQGAYTFTITAEGHPPFTDPSVVLSQSGNANDFQLIAANADATAGGTDIVVTGRRVQVSDFDRTTVGAVIPIGELATRVPVARDLTSVITLAPNTAVGDTAFGNLPAISGASVAENAYFVNGLNITDFRKGLGATTVPFEFYNTVEVKTGGFSAEFGRSTGGIVNATTKSGSNEFHAGALAIWEPDFLKEDAPSTYTYDNDFERIERREANFYVSGPIIKDHLFFYGLYAPREYERRRGRTSDRQAWYDKDTSPFWGGKIDAIITDGQRLEFTYFDTSQTIRRDIFTYDPDENRVSSYFSGIKFQSGGKNYVARYTGAFTDWLTISAAYGKNKNRDNTLSTTPDFSFIRDNRNPAADPDFSPISLGNPTSQFEVNQDTRKFYRADVDVFFNLFGAHHVRGGYDREDLTTVEDVAYNGGRAIQYYYTAAGNRFAPAGTQYVSARTYINNGGFKSRNEAYYIQDSWALFNNRITLNIGARNDKFENKNVAGVVYFNPGKQWAPRIGFTADPFGDGQTKIYGNFGIYYLPVAVNTNIRLGGAELDYTRYFRLDGLNSDNTPIYGDPLLFATASPCPDDGVVNCTIASDGQVRPTDSTVSKSLKPQRATEYILGVERRLGNRIRVGVYGTYRKLDRSLEDIAIDAAVGKLCAAEGIAGCDAPGYWSGFSQYVLSNPGDPATITLNQPLPGETEVRTVKFSAEDLGYPTVKRTYKAITATFDRDFDGTWSLSASYTWSKSKGNIEGGVQSDIGQDDSGLTQDFDQPGLTDGAYGYLPGDRRHVFKLYGSYQVTPWFNVGVQDQLYSPRSFGCIGYHPTDVFAQAYGAAARYCRVEGGDIVTDPNSTAPLTLVPRGSAFKGDWQNFTNLTLSFNLPTETVKSYFRVDVFNLFNQKAKIDFNEYGTDDGGASRADYGAVETYQTPRYFRLQFGVNF